MIELILHLGKIFTCIMAVVVAIGYAYVTIKSTQDFLKLPLETRTKFWKEFNESERRKQENRWF